MCEGQIENSHFETSSHIPTLIVYLAPLYTDLLTSCMPPVNLDLGHVDENKNTALHLSCLQGHEECALAILDKCPYDLVYVANGNEKT